MSDTNVAPPSGSDVKVPILIGSVVALLGANIYLFTQLSGLRTDFAEFRKATLGEFSSLKESSSVSTQTARRSLTSLKDEDMTALVKAGNNQAAKGLFLAGTNTHGNEMYGTMAVYLRLKGIVPPTTERQNAAKKSQ